MALSGNGTITPTLSFKKIRNKYNNIFLNINIVTNCDLLTQFHELLKKGKVDVTNMPLDAALFCCGHNMAYLL